jgi:(1->4)-alpha-D-glucan 1-alpha-D-glucosylmutase
MQIPRATYRLQFNEKFRLADALPLVPYFSALGISHLYASPLFKAAPHSAHGYDVCDFTQINPEIGTERDLEKFVRALRQKKMGLVLDIVPNHMGIASSENFWWQDVLKNGRASQFADYFDIDWNSTDHEVRGKILLPVLGDTYEKVLRAGELIIKKENGEFVLRYFDKKFPLAPNFVPQNFSEKKINSNHEALNSLIQQQNYRLACWRDGDLKLNYRRFFNVSSLAGIRVEEEKVFADSHALIARWLKKNWLDGLRVDHPDGLRDPENYLRRLRALAPDKWIVVEKILELNELLPQTWPVHGTTGYDFMNQAGGIFVDAAAEKTLTNFYAKFTGEKTDYAAIVREKKRLGLKKLFTPEIKRLAEILIPIAKTHSRAKNFSRENFSAALIEIAANFPVYRTYARENFISSTDKKNIELAISGARSSSKKLSKIFDFLRTLLLGPRGKMEKDFRARFQQLTGPAMAKGVEDTTFYCYNRFVALNEVGGDPGKFGVSVKALHQFFITQKKDWPHSMLGTSTHDTKRGEDFRARLCVLAEIPETWIETVQRWAKKKARHRKNFSDRNAEYFFYQTLVGAWPLSEKRAQAYMQKVVREAKQHTDWANPNSDYEKSLRHFIAAIFKDTEFLQEVKNFLAEIADAGFVNSLAQTLLKMTAPGVPDFYQGSELWNFSLVDPDNRQPVDFKIREKFLTLLKNLSGEKVWQQRAKGLPKLWLIQKVLALRAKNLEWFDENYDPLFAHGEKSEHIVAFARGKNLMVIVPRLTLKLKNAWGATSLKLPRGNWRNEFTGENFSEKVLLRELFQKFPIALLLKKESK